MPFDDLGLPQDYTPQLHRNCPNCRANKWNPVPMTALSDWECCECGTVVDDEGKEMHGPKTKEAAK